MSYQISAKLPCTPKRTPVGFLVDFRCAYCGGVYEQANR